MSELIKNRRSIRRYKEGEAVSREQLDALLEVAMLAPSACNSRPWEFIAITKREVIDEIARIHSNAIMCKATVGYIYIK